MLSTEQNTPSAGALRAAAEINLHFKGTGIQFATLTLGKLIDEHTGARELADSLKQTLFALESVLMLSGSALPPQSIPELGKYARAARATLKRYAPRA